MTLNVLADIGGTNTRVALANGAVVDRASEAKFSNQDYHAKGQDIAHILRDYLAQTGAKVSGVCVAAAGPVQDGVAEMTNLAWVIDGKKLTDATGAERVAILNDLQAQGHALGHVAGDALNTVLSGPARPGAAMLVVGLGTGVNAAPVHQTRHGRFVAPSECGHMNMPIRSEEHLRLMRFVEDLLRQRGETPHCGVEEVLSGRGLANLGLFAAKEAGAAAPKDSADLLAQLAAGSPVAAHAARLYTEILAMTLADLALIHLPYGGIYLIGGMGRAMAPHFATYGLEATFRQARRVDLLETDFSVTVVEDDFAALTGCAAYLEGLSH